MKVVLDGHFCDIFLYLYSLALFLFSSVFLLPDSSATYSLPSIPQPLPNNFLKIASSFSSIRFVLTFAIRQTLLKTYKNRCPGARNRAKF